MAQINIILEHIIFKQVNKILFVGNKIFVCLKFCLAEKKKISKNRMQNFMKHTMFIFGDKESIIGDRSQIYKM